MKCLWLFCSWDSGAVEEKEEKEWKKTYLPPHWMGHYLFKPTFRIDHNLIV